MELVFGHPSFWFILFFCSLAGWVIYGLVKFIIRRRFEKSGKLRSWSYNEYKSAWPSVLAILATCATLIMGLVSGLYVHDSTPHTYYARVVAPETVAVDGSHYVELRGFRSAWTCQSTDNCSDLVLGGWAEYTAYAGADGYWVRYNLRPYVAEAE